MFEGLEAGLVRMSIPCNVPEETRGFFEDQLKNFGTSDIGDIFYDVFGISRDDVVVELLKKSDDEDVQYLEYLEISTKTGVQEDVYEEVKFEFAEDNIEDFLRLSNSYLMSKDLKPVDYMPKYSMFTKKFEIYDLDAENL